MGDTHSFNIPDTTADKRRVDRLAKRLGVGLSEGGVVGVEGTSGVYSLYEIMNAFLDRIDETTW